MNLRLLCFCCVLSGWSAFAGQVIINPAVPYNTTEDDLRQLKKLTLGVGWEFSPNKDTTAKLKEIGIRKIRCINVDALPGKFDEKGNYIIDTSKKSRLDHHLDTCRELGAIPHIIIANGLPEALRKTIAADSDEGRVMGLKRNTAVGPTDYNLFRNYLVAYFEYVMITKGFKNAVFEAFNEPDIGGTITPTGKKPPLGSAELYDYMFRLYREVSAAAQIFEQHHPEAKLTLGGPALSWAYSFRFGAFNWGERFLADVAREKLRLDFMGIHYYGNISSINGEYKALYPSFTEMLSSLKSARDKHRPGLPIQINEWGPSYRVNNTDLAMVNADHVGTAWSAEFLKTMLENGIDDAIYLVTTDFSAQQEGKMVNVWGWCSLFVNPAVLGRAYPKAAYNLFRMVSQLNGTRIESSRYDTVNTLAFADAEKKKIQILIWNYGAEIPESKLTVETAKTQSPNLIIRDAVKFFGSEKILMSRSLISRDHANIYEVHKQGKPLTMRAATLQINDAKSLSADAEELTFTLELPANSVSLIELEVETPEALTRVTPPQSTYDAENPPVATPKTVPDFPKQAAVWINGGSAARANIARHKMDDSFSGTVVYHLNKEPATGEFKVEYEFEIQADGNYTIFGALITQGAGHASPLEFCIDGGDWRPVPRNPVGKPVWGVSSALSWNHVDSQYLASGKHTLAFRYNKQAKIGQWSFLCDGIAIFN